MRVLVFLDWCKNVEAGRCISKRKTCIHFYIYRGGQEKLNSSTAQHDRTGNSITHIPCFTIFVSPSTCFCPHNV